MQNYRLCFFIILGLTLILMLFIYIVDNDSRIATKPEKILEKANIEFPYYKIVYQDDNMERSSSSWNVYEYKAEFEKPLDQNFVNLLENKIKKTGSGWTKVDSVNYQFKDNEKEECFTSIYVNIIESNMYVEYTWQDLF